MENQLNFSLEESYRHIAFSQLGVSWQFESFLKVEALYTLQNLLQSSTCAENAEEHRIRLNVAEGGTSLPFVSNRGHYYRKQAVLFLEQQIKEDQVIMTNFVLDARGTKINQEFLKEQGSVEFPFFFELFLRLGMEICAWSLLREQQLKKN